VAAGVPGFEWGQAGQIGLRCRLAGRGGDPSLHPGL